MIEFSGNQIKIRCFYANKCFRNAMCDSNHKKQGPKSSTIAQSALMGFLLYWKSCMCTFNFSKGESQ